MTSKTLVPFVKNNVLSIPKGIKKAFIHPDQIFSSGVAGKVAHCFSFCNRYDELPAGTLPESEVVFSTDESYIAIELGNTCQITAVRYGPTVGPITVLQGAYIHNLAERIILDESGGGIASPHTFSKTQTKLIVFMAPAGTRMPAVEILSDRTVAPMPNPEPLPKFCDPNELLQTLDNTRLPLDDMALTQKTLIPDKLFVLNSKWVMSPDDKRAVRINPCEVRGVPIGIDDNLNLLRRQVKGRTDFAIYSGDLDYGTQLFWYCLIRYGNHKRYTRNPETDPLFTDTDWIYQNPMSMEFVNKEKTGLKVIDSIMLWPKDRFTTPDAYAEKQVELFILAKTHDITVPVFSMPMPPEKDYLYFAYRYGLDKTGSAPWDRVVVSVQSTEELETLREFMGAYHKYCPKSGITLIIDFRPSPSNWPGILYYAMLLGIDKVVFSNEEDLYSREKQRWETIFQPNSFFKNFVLWRQEIKDRKPVDVQIVGDITRVISKIPQSRDWMEHFMLSYNSNPDANPVVSGVPVIMPVGHHLNEQRHWRSLEQEGRKTVKAWME